MNVKRTPILMPSSVAVLGLLVLLTGVYFLIPPVNVALRPTVFKLVGLLVIALLIRELAERPAGGGGSPHSPFLE